MGSMADQTRVKAQSSAEQLHRQLGAMRSGNAGEVLKRDLSLVPGPFWSTRRVPACAHHFTRSEFEAYLLLERFPMNTLVDRIVEHTQDIRRALVAGKAVPLEVMQDEAGQEALGLAEMDVGAAAESARKTAQQTEAVFMFELAIGLYAPGGKPLEVVRELLMAAARAHLERPASHVESGLYGWVTGGYKRVDLPNHERAILIGMRAGPGGSNWLEFRDSGWPVGSLYGELRRISYLEADGIYSKAVIAGDLGFEQARSVMGARWRPYVTVQVCESAGSV